MNGLNTISKVQKEATIREYAAAIRLENYKLASRIKDANVGLITETEFLKVLLR